MPDTSLIDTWIDSSIERSEQTFRLKQLYELQAEFLYDQYEPTKAFPSDAGLTFITRLDRWIAQFSDHRDQWAVFNTLKYFFFVGIVETEELYRCAVQHSLYPWLIDKCGLDIFDPAFDEKLSVEMSKVWPCPVTDSLRINSLLHRTQLSGQSLRPDWLSMKEFSNEENIAAYIKRNNINYLALFEDFSGSGFQCSRAIKHALKVFDGPILVTPLVICAPGDAALRELEREFPQISYRPIVVLTEDCLVREEPTLNEPPSFRALRRAIKNGAAIGGFEDDPFGFGGIASLAATYSNCPNNSPLIYHSSSKTWPHALFPRIDRKKKTS